MRTVIAALSVVFFAVTTFAAPTRAPLIVHEWGTFTSLQDDTGRAIGGLNSSAEPLPLFVHRLRHGFIINGGVEESAVEVFLKNDPRAHPDVTMRMETPVIYFYPADKGAAPITLDVTATFKGGLLTEYYPNAKFHVEGGTPAPAGISRITSNTTGSLSWKGLRVGGEVKLPETKEHVWLAPRKVNSAPVAMGSEGEQYVFYRGVGNVPSPVTVLRADDRITLLGTSAALENAKWGPMWLAEFRTDGSCAFRTIRNAPQMINTRTPGMAATFQAADFSKERLVELRKEMRTALISDGLFEDEAEAMLSTWERSYFQGAGQRLFFLVPRVWTDAVVPLSVSVPHEMTRVMMGRIELVTPAQREAIERLAGGQPRGGGESREQLLAGLGRFGYALILDELRQRPNPPLAAFAKASGIVAFTPATRPASTQPVTVRSRTLDGKAFTLTGVDAMLHAIMTADESTVAALLNEGTIDLNRKISDDWTLLHLAAQKGNVAIVRLLLKHGATPEVRNKGGLTPQQVATLGNHAAVAQELRKHDATQ